MPVFNPDNIRSLVEERFACAFSGDLVPLAELSEVVASIIAMPGIASFTTRLPWEIKIQGGEVIEGLSENLLFASKDISAQLQRMLAMGITAQTPIALSVSDKRLEAELPSFLPLGVVNA